jgi:hypothetical protein
VSESLQHIIIAQWAGQRQQAPVAIRRVCEKCQAGNRKKMLPKKNVSMKSGNQAEPRLQEQRNSGEYGSDEHLLSSFLLLPQWTIQSAEAMNTSGLQHSLWMSFWNLVQNSPLVGPGCAWQHPVH